MKYIFLSGIVCLFATVMFAQTIELEKLNRSINTTYGEISPVVSRDGKTLYFTRVADPDFNKTLIIEGKDVYTTEPTRYNVYLQETYAQLMGGRIENPGASEFNQDVWVAESVNDYFDRVYHPGTPLNNALPNSICAITPEPDEFIIINEFDEKGGMKSGFSTIRQYADGSWGFPQPIQIGSYYNYSEAVNFTMSSDGDVLILSLIREDSHGMHDLYVSFREGENQWSVPKNLGWGANSPYDELTPTLSDDKKLLYFSSTRTGGAGGSDIYYVERLTENWERWSAPKPMQSPINTSSNESQPYFNRATGFLYFCSNRDGNSDIFRVQVREPEPQTEIVIKGRIINAATKDIMPAKVYSGFADVNKFKNFYVSSDGTFRMTIPKGKPYKIIAQAEGFFGRQETISFKEDFYYFKAIEIDLILNPMAENAQISIDPIYFEQSKANILRRSFPALDDLVAILKEHATMEVRIEGHTDNIGDKSLLQKLSDDRAKAVKDYLVGQGIAGGRIETRGYGAARPISSNDDETTRSVNRRVEVRITKSE